MSFVHSSQYVRLCRLQWLRVHVQAIWLFRISLSRDDERTTTQVLVVLSGVGVAGGVVMLAFHCTEKTS